MENKHQLVQGNFKWGVGSGGLVATRTAITIRQTASCLHKLSSYNYNNDNGQQQCLRVCQSEYVYCVCVSVCECVCMLFIYAQKLLPLLRRDTSSTCKQTNCRATTHLPCLSKICLCVWVSVCACVCVFIVCTFGNCKNFAFSGQGRLRNWRDYGLKSEMEIGIWHPQADNCLV